MKFKRGEDPYNSLDIGWWQNIKLIPTMYITLLEPVFAYNNKTYTASELETILDFEIGANPIFIKPYFKKGHNFLYCGSYFIPYYTNRNRSTRSTRKLSKQWVIDHHDIFKPLSK